MVTFRAPPRAMRVIALEAPLLRRSAAGKLARTMGSARFLLCRSSRQLEIHLSNGLMRCGSIIRLRLQNNGRVLLPN